MCCLPGSDLCSVKWGKCSRELEDPNAACELAASSSQQHSPSWLVCVNPPVTQKIKYFTSPSETGHKCSFGSDSEKHSSVLCFVSGVAQGNQMHWQAQDLLKAAHPSCVVNSLRHGRGREVVVSTSLAALWLQPVNSNYPKLLFGFALCRMKTLQSNTF